MFRYFHFCNHKVRLKNQREEEHTVKVINHGTNIDLVIKGASVLAIKNVRAIKYKDRKETEQLIWDNVPREIFDNPQLYKGHYDSPHYYFHDYSKYFKPGNEVSENLPKEFYNPYLKNRILWNVEPPLEYELDVIIKFDKNKEAYHDPKLCDLCDGRGWYIDILNTNGEFESDRGVMKVAQNVVKDLLTELFSSVLELSYGTVIKRVIASNAIDDEELFDDIRMIISEVEDNYLKRQNLVLQTLDGTEILIELKIINLSRSPQDPTKIRLDLRIITEEEENDIRLSF